MMQLADLLEANLDALLKPWVALVDASLAPGPRSESELADHIPAFLRQVVAALRVPDLHLDAAPVVEASHIGREHGAQRFRLGFALAAVVREYGLLLRVLLDFAASSGAPLSIDAMRRLTELFTSAMAEATEEHTRRLDQARKEAEAAQQRLLAEVQRSEESFRTLAESLPDTVWTTDAQHRVLWMNSVLPRITGLSHDELLRGGFGVLVHPDDLADTSAAWQSSVPTGAPLDVQHRVRQADGTYRWHLVRVRPTHDSGGAVAGWIGTSTDIHEQRERQAELERRHDFEQHLVGIVSHDLRSPLSAILLGATALLDEDPDELTTKIVQRIRSSAEWSARMIRDLLDFTEARLGGGIKLEKRASDLFTLTSTVVDEVEATSPDRVRVRRSGDTAGTWDADRIVQVVSNLVTNAVKYSPAGTPIAVGVTGQERAVELTVHNEGTPIPPEQIGRLFEPLRRATDQIDRKTRSVGLGLYIVDSIVKAHGGTVGVVSTAEAGTTFTVRLPRS